MAVPTGFPTGTLTNTAEDTAVVIDSSTLLAGFTDPDGDSLAVENIQASDGAITPNGDGSYTYMPSPDFNGTVTLTYTVSDGLGGEIAGVSQSFEVTPVNDIPTGEEIIDFALVGSYSLDDGFLGGALAVHEELVLLASWDIKDWSQDLHVINVTDPAAPILISTIDSDAGDVEIVGDYAYLASDADGFQIVDLSDPTNPTVVSGLATSQFAEGIAVSGDYAYLTDHSGVLIGGDDGLHIIDISDPLNPFFIGHYSALDSAADVDLIGDYAYVISHHEAISIIDVSDPSTPVLVDNISGLPTYTSGYTDIEISGEYAYITNGNFGLTILDVSSPENPNIVTQINEPGFEQSVTVVDSYAYVTTDFGTGLYVIDITNPAEPIMVDRAITPPLDSYGVEVVNDYIYLSVYGGNVDSGLQILEPIFGPGLATIDGTGLVNSPLTASLAALNDADGLPDSSTFLYQWQVSPDGGTTWTDITGATNSTFTPTDSYLGQQVRVTVIYTDLGGTTEIVTSDSSLVKDITPHANFNQDASSDVAFVLPNGDLYVGYAPVDITDDFALASMDLLLSADGVGDARPMAIGDLDQDGLEDDILLRDTTSGMLSVAFTAFEDGETIVTGEVDILPELTSDWAVVGIGDHDANGYNNDILFFHSDTQSLAVWFVESGIVSAVTMYDLADTLTPDWEILAVGDFDDDATTDDLALKNMQTGAVELWIMDNYTILDTITLTPQFDDTRFIEGLHVAGVGDFDGDTKADDILWQNTLLNINSIWFTENGSIVETLYTSTDQDLLLAV